MSHELSKEETKIPSFAKILFDGFFISIKHLLCLHKYKKCEKLNGYQPFDGNNIVWKPVDIVECKKCGLIKSII